jgi:hypothetical protein
MRGSHVPHQVPFLLFFQDGVLFFQDDMRVIRDNVPLSLIDRMRELVSLA